MFKLKMNEEMRHDHEDDFQSDDEENQAETNYENGEEDDSESDAESTKPECMEDITPAWPQSFRQSTDILLSCTPPSINVLKRSISGLSRNESQISDANSSLSKPLISADLEKEVPALTIPVKSIDSVHSRASFHELPLPQTSSYSQAQLNAINILCGIGMMTVPYAISEGGWFSLSALLLLALVFSYTGVLLKECMDSSPEIESYPDIGQVAFGQAGRVVVFIALYAELYAACVEYLIMTAENLSYLFPNASMSFAGMDLYSVNLFATLSFLILLPTVWVRDLGLLSYLSFAGVVSSALLVVSLLWVKVEAHIEFHPTGTTLDLANLPFVLGIYGFCFAGHSVFPNIYTSMKEPSRFPIVLVVSFIICCILYCGVGVCGFLMFGKSIKSQFTLNMPRKFVSSKLALWTGVVNPMAKYALTLNPVALSLEEFLPKDGSRISSILIRTSLAFSTLLVVVAVPFFAVVMSLAGALFAMLLAIIFPCSFYLRICRHRITRLQIAQCSLAIMVGVLVAIAGTLSATKKLFNILS